MEKAQKQRPAKTSVTVADLVARVKTAKGVAGANLEDKKIERVLRAAFSELAAQVGAVKAGALAIGGLGQFTVVEQTKEKDGQGVTRQRVVFRAAKPRAAAAGAAPGAAAKKAGKKAKKAARKTAAA